MSQTAAHLVDHVVPHVPVRQWVRVCQLRLPIPLRVLLAAQPELVTPVLQVVQRVVERHLLDHTGLKSDEGPGGAVTLIQRFGSAADLNIHLHCLGLDGVAGLGDGAGLAGRAGCRRRGGAHAAAAAGGGHQLAGRYHARPPPASACAPTSTVSEAAVLSVVKGARRPVARRCAGPSPSGSGRRLPVVPAAARARVPSAA